MCRDGSENTRKSERYPLDERMEFILYLDAYKAAAVNISNEGISFDTDKPIYIRLQINIDGEEVTRDASLVWAKKKDEGGIRYGFEFIPDLD